MNPVSEDPGTVQTLRSAVTCGLLVGICFSATLAAASPSPAPESPQNQTEPRDVEALRLEAEQGDAEAQANLGAQYRYGAGVLPDHAVAVYWFRLAADQGEPFAQRDLGLMYGEGLGVSQDNVAAHMWLSLATTHISEDARDAVITARDAIAEEMTPEQIAEAERLAREWRPTPPLRQ